MICRTSEHEVEVHCHGGQAAVETIWRGLAGAGCTPSTWQDLARQQQKDTIEAEARIALAEASTQRTAAILLDQMHGALRNALQAIGNDITAGRIDAARDALSQLHARASAGLHLTTPFRVVLAGPPNVGKSSLINAILGYARSIVFDQPGTTRDVLTALTALEGWPVEFSDTAGLRVSSDDIEQQGVAAARGRLREADLIVLVCDASVPVTREETALLEEFPQALVVENKCDLPRAAERAQSPRLWVSAATGSGLADWIAQMLQRLLPAPLAAGDAVPFTPRQVSEIQAAAGALDANDGTAALAAIGRIIW